MFIKNGLVFIISVAMCVLALANPDTKVFPQNFVYLSDIDSSIIQEMRYASNHNFIGHSLIGYQFPVCILTIQAAIQLKKIQKAIKPLGYSLKVYDCYRPQKTVDFFVEWSKSSAESMKGEFYPRVNKKDFFKLDYVAEKSGHTRGSTVDLTLVKLPVHSEQKYNPKNTLVSCYASVNKRFHDNMIDMGTGYDCLDEKAHLDNTEISQQAYLNRMLLRYWMFKYGFSGIESEWWHFTLKNEPYPDSYFNFVVG